MARPARFLASYRLASGLISALQNEHRIPPAASAFRPSTSHAGWRWAGRTHLSGRPANARVSARKRADVSARLRALLPGRFASRRCSAARRPEDIRAPLTWRKHTDSHCSWAAVGQARPRDRQTARPLPAETGPTPECGRPSSATPAGTSNQQSANWIRQTDAQASGHSRALSSCIHSSRPDRNKQCGRLFRSADRSPRQWSRPDPHRPPVCTADGGWRTAVQPPIRRRPPTSISESICPAVWPPACRSLKWQPEWLAGGRYFRVAAVSFATNYCSLHCRRRQGCTCHRGRCGRHRSALAMKSPRRRAANCRPVERSRVAGVMVASRILWARDRRCQPRASPSPVSHQVGHFFHPLLQPSAVFQAARSLQCIQRRLRSS